MPTLNKISYLFRTSGLSLPKRFMFSFSRCGVNVTRLTNCSNPNILLPRRTYQMEALEGGSLTNNPGVKQQDSTGKHPVGVRKDCANPDCDKALCNPDDPACLKFINRLAIFNLTHWDKVKVKNTANNSTNKISTVLLDDTQDFSGNQKEKQYAYPFDPQISLKESEGTRNIDATKFCNRNDIRHKIEDKIINK